jgi:hypothetical protein
MEKIEIERKNGMVSLSLCGEILKCETCTNMINKINRINAMEVFEEFGNKNSLIHITMTLSPSSYTKDYFSFDGIRGLLNQIFQLKEHRDEKGVVKIYFYKKKLHIEVLYFYLINEQFHINLKNLQSSFPFNDKSSKFSFQEYHLPKGLEPGNELLEVPLNVGQGTLNESKFLLKLGFTTEQLKEMDYFIGTGLKIFNLSEIFDNSIFKLEKKMSQENNIHKVVTGHLGFFD